MVIQRRDCSACPIRGNVKDDLLQNLLVDAVIYDPPLGGFVAQNHALGGQAFVRKGGSKQNAFVLPVRGPGELMSERRTNKGTRENPTERDAASFHRPDELFFGGCLSQPVRLRCVGAGVVSRVYQGEPCCGRRARFFFTGSFFRRRFLGSRIVPGASLQNCQANASGKSQHQPHATTV